MKRYLNDELISRADPSGLAIPALSPAEGVTFVDDLMHAAAIPGIEPPVDADVTPFVVDLIGQLTVITPRRLMKAAGQVLSEGKLDMEDGVIGRITRPYAASILTPAVLAQIAGDSEQE